MKDRYFNLKFGNPKANGCIIKVRPNALLEERVIDFIENDEVTMSRFELIEQSKIGILYKMIIPNAEFSAGNGNIPTLSIKAVAPGYVKKGKDKIIQLLVDPNGKVSIHQAGRKRVYLTEISEYQARKLKSDAESWKATQLYVFS